LARQVLTDNALPTVVELTHWGPSGLAESRSNAIGAGYGGRVGAAHFPLRVGLSGVVIQRVLTDGAAAAFVFATAQQGGTQGYQGGEKCRFFYGN